MARFERLRAGTWAEGQATVRRINETHRVANIMGNEAAGEIAFVLMPQADAHGQMPDGEPAVIYLPMGQLQLSHLNEQRANWGFDPVSIYACEWVAVLPKVAQALTPLGAMWHFGAEGSDWIEIFAAALFAGAELVVPSKLATTQWQLHVHVTRDPARHWIGSAFNAARSCAWRGLHMRREECPVAMAAWLDQLMHGRALHSPKDQSTQRVQDTRFRRLQAAGASL